MQSPERSDLGADGNSRQQTEYFFAPRYCTACKQPLDSYEYFRSECHDCRSPLGKMADLFVAIHADGDTTDRIREWKEIRGHLTGAFGECPLGDGIWDQKLWKLMADHLEIKGWDGERLLRTSYNEFIELLKSKTLLLRKIPLHDKAGPIGLVTLSELTKLCTASLQQNKRQGTLYRDDSGRFIYHVWDCDDDSVIRACQLLRPAVAYEIALKADRFFGDKDELIAELVEQTLRTGRQANSEGRPTELIGLLRDGVTPTAVTTSNDSIDPLNASESRAPINPGGQAKEEKGAPRRRVALELIRYHCSEEIFRYDGELSILEAKYCKASDLMKAASSKRDAVYDALTAFFGSTECYKGACRQACGGNQEALRKGLGLAMRALDG